MIDEIYEIRISGNDIQISKNKWDKIREYARGHKFFYVIYKGNKYKYTHAQTYMERPTRFDFDMVSEGKEGIIEYIYVE